MKIIARKVERIAKKSTQTEITRLIFVFDFIFLLFNYLILGWKVWKVKFIVRSVIKFKLTYMTNISNMSF